MKVESKWEWFYQMVEAEIEPAFDDFGFHRLTGRGYEEGENKEWMTVLFYENTATSTRATIDIRHYRELYGDDPKVYYYVVRIGIGRIDLKRFLYPTITEDTDDPKLWDGWKCYTQEEVPEILKELAEGLRIYLSQ